MCLAIPAQVKNFINDKLLLADFGKGVYREVSIALMSEKLEVGDWILIHTGYVVSKMEPEEAQETLALWEELWEFEQKNKPSTPTS
ncbi:MAG: HypC/HybG/HupF family hydrogenase formation chaperone [Candidatus Hodarchaeales archaeon]|jgi:hydrogenase expression/formation protein HypC